MSKKLMIIIINFIVIIVVTVLIMNQVNEYKGLERVYVAKTLIKKGAKITPEMVQLKKVTLNHEAKSSDSSKLVTYYDDVIKDDEEDEFKGHYAKYNIIKGEILVKDKLKEEKSTHNNYMYNLPKGYYAYTIENTSPGGVIKANDYIDLYIYTEGEEYSGVVDEPALRHLRVYDLRDKKGNSLVEKSDEKSEDDKSSDEETKVAKYIVLALNDYQLGKLIEYQQKDAAIRVAIRKRPSSEYKIYHYPEKPYLPFATSKDEFYNESREQELIEANKRLIDEDIDDKDIRDILEEMKKEEKQKNKETDKETDKETEEENKNETNKGDTETNNSVSQN